MKKRKITKTSSFLARVEDKIVKLIIPVFAISSVVLIPYLGITIPKVELRDILQAFAQLNVTVAIGIGTLAIAIRAPDNTKVELIKEILTILMISVFSFLLSFIHHEGIQRVYIILSGLVLIYILVTTANYILKINESKGNKRKSTKRRKK
ncbi:hypothetical protein [Oceanobacillus sp. FSL H7-0719]|uniref:hypothetical protein n=1 Tax=Oceanobacillus sp. FSL H7-0719 TaxID=2954507 RepID=UPI00324F0FBC